MTRKAQFGTGLLGTLIVTVALSAALFFVSHASQPFDNAFFPILGSAAGVGVVLLPVGRTRLFGLGVVCGAGASLVLQSAALISMLFVYGGS